jgi:hypothetical protein
LVELIADCDASEQVAAVHADLGAPRKMPWINNFWTAIATRPPTPRRLWRNTKEVLAPGALDPELPSSPHGRQIPGAVTGQ